VKYEQLSKESKKFVDTQAKKKGVSREEILAQFDSASSGKRVKDRGLLS